MSSFSRNFTGSAMICSNPFGPTRLGPRRACTNPSSRRSIQFIAATITCTMMKATRNLTRGQTRYCIQGFIAPPRMRFEVRGSRFEGRGTPLVFLPFPSNLEPRTSSSVHFSQHDINGPNQGDEIRYKVSLGHGRERLQIDERWRPHAEAIGVLRFAIADDVVAQLSFRRLDGVVDLPFRRPDHPRDFRFDVAGRRGLDHGDALLEDAPRLPHLRHAHKIAIVRVAVLPDGNLELQLGIALVRLRPPQVPLHARSAQGWSGDAPVDGLFGRDHADAHGAPLPDAIVGQQ